MASENAAAVRSQTADSTGNDGAPVEDVYNMVPEPVKRTETCERAEITFRDLRYTVQVKDSVAKKPTQKPILHGITGAFKPGRLSVILGPSGAGKTSLLNIIAGEVHHGTIKGELLVNGQPTSGRELRKMAGYVHQDDIIYPTMTVRESLSMYARLRIPSTVSPEAKHERVEDIISLLHLEKAADTRIGNHWKRGISGGEKKRVSVGAELVNNPSVLFLDEPTSGLDAYTAFRVMQMLRRLARGGRTVVATLHQPSSEIFHLIDDLMLLAEGRTLYFGPASKSIDYFSRHGSVCPRYSNPADFFFTTIMRSANADSEARPSIASDKGAERMAEMGEINSISGEEDSDALMLHQLLDAWPDTPEGRRMNDTAQNPSQTGFKCQQPRCKSKFSDQLAILFKRELLHYIRDRFVMYLKVASLVMLSLILSAIYWNIPDNTQASQSQNRAGIMFFLVIYNILNTAMIILAIFTLERDIFEREHSAGLYGPTAYFISKLAVNLPLYIISPVALVAIIYYTVALTPGADHLFMMALIIAVLTAVGISIGMAISNMFKQLIVALSMAPIIILPFIIFSGQVVNLEQLPVGIRWLQWLSPLKYGYVALMTNELESVDVWCGSSVPDELCRPIPGQEVLKALGLEGQGTIWENIVAMIGFCVLFLCISYLGLRRAAHQRRAGKRLKKD